MDVVKVRIPSKPQYISTLRLMTSSLANSLQFDIEAVDDLRVCVSEAVNDLLLQNEVIEVCFRLEETQMSIEIRAEHLEEASTRSEEEKEVHRMILESLLDTFHSEEDRLLLVKRKKV